jgi:hypothetical protein
MANVYIEARPLGWSRIDDYVIEDDAGRAIAAYKTQSEGILWAKSQGHSPFIARIRHLNDKKNPDHWREC